MADQFTLAVVQAGLDAAAEEMFEVLRKTAMSPIIYEVLDVGTGITDADGALVSSGAGIPSFVGVLDKAVSAIIATAQEIAEGDVFITNDPNHGGVTHLNDVVLAEPVFHAGTRVAWVASIAHWGDIGGACPGSMSVTAESIVAEGLRLPIVKLFAQGQLNASVFDILKVNSRLPDFVEGDLWAQISAGRRAAGLIRGLCERFDIATLEAAIEVAFRQGEARSRAGLASLAPGHYCIDQEQDDGSRWQASITIAEDVFLVDLRDAPTQHSGPHNTSRDGAVIACQMLFKALTDAERYANAGSFAPLQVLTTPGTIFHAGPTAPHGYYFETRIRLFDMLWHCLAQAMPQRLPAGHFASIFGTVIAGRHADTQRAYTMVEPQMGGWGATTHRDGEGPMFSTSHGDTFNCPVELAEARYGLQVEAKAMCAAPSQGVGPRGGAGLKTCYRMRAPAKVSIGFSHGRVPVWSHAGGEPGGINRVRIIRHTGAVEDYSAAFNAALEPGDQVELTTAYGGGSNSLS